MAETFEPIPNAGLLEAARDAGFHAAGICAAQAPPHLEAYEAWLMAGRHGTMDYLQRHLPLKAHPRTLLPGVQSILAVALDYGQPAPASDVRIARYALGKDYHRVVRRRLKRVENWARTHYPGIKTRICVDSAPILEREYAHLAGLGWFGKNTMLIDSRRGSWFVIGLMLLDQAFQPTAPSPGGCGSCRKCIDACPTGAIVESGGRWQIEARRCISYLTIEHKGPIEPELAAKIGSWTFGCDICQEVCPFNQPRETQPERARPTDVPEFLATRAWPSLEEIGDMSEEDWSELTEGSPVRRAGFDGLKRNAAINLKNR